MPRHGGLRDVRGTLGALFSNRPRFVGAGERLPASFDRCESRMRAERSPMGDLITSPASKGPATDLDGDPPAAYNAARIRPCRQPSGQETS
jgi:hypothetical protein